MIKEIKKIGGSHVIILDKDTRKFFDIDEGDFVDIADIVKCNRRNNK